MHNRNNLKNVKRLEHWLNNVSFIFGIINVFLLLISQLFQHGSLSYSSVSYTFLLFTKSTNITKVSLISVIVHWYKSAIDNTLVLNTFISAIFSIEFLVYTTIFYSKLRLENELKMYEYLKPKTKNISQSFPNVESFIIFMDFCFFESNFMTMTVLAILYLHRLLYIKATFGNSLVVWTVGLADVILLMFATSNRFCFEIRLGDLEASIDHKIYCFAIGLVYLLTLIYDMIGIIK